MQCNFRRNVLDSLHSLGHPSIRAAQKLVTACYVWPDVNKDVDHVHIDIVGPVSQGNSSYILTCIDHFTRWPEAQPISDITAKTVAQAFVHIWISCFGVPSMVTDRRQHFESALWSTLMQLMGCKHICTTSYHPIANGMIECFHHQLKSILKIIP